MWTSFVGVELLSHIITLGLIFWGNCQTVFQSLCAILYSYQQCVKVPVYCILIITGDWPYFKIKKIYLFGLIGIFYLHDLWDLRSLIRD